MLLPCLPSGKLELKIPWKKLTKDPLVVSIDDVYVILEPDLDMHYDPEKALKRQRKEKEKKIKDYEEAAKKRKLKESKWKGRREREREREREFESWWRGWGGEVVEHSCCVVTLVGFFA